MKHAVEFSKFIEIKYLPWNINFNRHFFLQLLHPNYIYPNYYSLDFVYHIFFTQGCTYSTCIVILFALWNNFFRYILFTTYHNYYYLVTTEIDLLLIYLCKCKNPSFVIPLPPKKSGLLWLHKLLYLILFYNLKSKPITYLRAKYKYIPSAQCLNGIKFFIKLDLNLYSICFENIFSICSFG